MTELPLHEGFHRLRMLALYRSGRQSDALRVYQQLRRRLRDDLGIDPSPDVRATEQAILEQAPDLLPGCCLVHASPAVADTALVLRRTSTPRSPPSPISSIAPVSSR